MSTTFIVRVRYHFEQNGKKVSNDYTDDLAVTATDFNTLKGKITQTNPGTVVFDSVQNIHTGSATS